MAPVKDCWERAGSVVETQDHLADSIVIGQREFFPTSSWCYDCPRLLRKHDVNEVITRPRVGNTCWNASERVCVCVCGIKAIIDLLVQSV